MPLLSRPLRLGLGCALALAVVAPVRGNALDVAGRCTVQFLGSSTLHDWEGTAPCALLAIDAPDASGRYGARAEVAVAQMDTGIASRDKKMRATLEAKKFPRIVATFASIDPAAVRSQQTGALSFRISLHGVERTIAPVISDYSEVPGKSARFKASFTLSLRDFGLKAPVVMGFIRVEDSVNVVVDVDLTAKNGAPAAGAPTR
jgi:hypothetical protein